MFLGGRWYVSRLFFLCLQSPCLFLGKLRLFENCLVSLFFLISVHILQRAVVPMRCTSMNRHVQELCNCR
jgi:hypothetical protein